MKRPLRYIRQHLSLRLGLIITLIIAVAFTLLSDVLFERCRHFIQRAAIDHASQLLDNTAERINGIMDETELVTNFMARTVPSHLSPDSLLAFIQKMYHEIRTPLNIIGGFTQVLTASLPDLPAEEIADITGRISESATDIARLAKDLDRVASSNQEEFVNNVG